MKFFINFFVSVLLLVACNAASIQQEVRAPILPELPDPMIIDDIVDEVIENEYATGTVSLTNAQILGLSTVTDDFNYIALTGNTTMRIDAPMALTIEGDYAINAVVTLPESEPMTIEGTGRLHFVIDSAKMFITCRLPLFGNVRITQLDIYPEISAVSGSAENLLVDGELVDWMKFSENFQQHFDSVWIPMKEPLIAALEQLVTDVAGECTVAELVAGLIGGNLPDCLNLPTTPPAVAKA